MQTREAFVGYLDETAPIDCPYGVVQRVVTGGAGGVANVHVVELAGGLPTIMRVTMRSITFSRAMESWS